ncbi:PIN domain-containing protein (plasmid) [Streptomyces sp. NBC_01520]|uniref:PIN domain-containing protein n=1 Tax=Streptomyces sp. NBC_01520 TaxID=2903892 RepID=UPI002F909F59
MIILDTCVIYGMKLDGPEAFLLRAIREAGTEQVAVPWMVVEERAAQLAIKYNEAHEKATVALRQLKREIPNDVPALGAPETEAVREHWRGKLKELVKVLPTSEAALREGMYREANVLPPASSMPHPTKQNKRLKVGARDAAIWMSTVEYARANPEETVYFVSSNTSDFRTGTGPYPPPMDADVEGLGDRFVHLTRLADLLKLIAPPIEVTSEQVEELLPLYTDNIRKAALTRWGNPLNPMSSRFPVVRQNGLAQATDGWLTRDSLDVKAAKVTDVQGYRLGDREWCTATVQWQFIGVAIFPGALDASCCIWNTRILMPVVEGGLSLRILSAEAPEAPAGNQDIQWPALPDAHERTREVLQLLKGLTPTPRQEVLSDQLHRQMQLMGDPMRRFIEDERYQKIAMDAAADAAAEAAAAEGWDTGDDDDLWNALE